MLQRGHSGDGCDLASTLCKYDLRKRDLFVLSWARGFRVISQSRVQTNILIQIRYFTKFFTAEHYFTVRRVSTMVA